MAAAQAGALEWGIELDTAVIRSALAYERGLLPLMTFKVAAVVNVLLVTLIAGNRGACRTGGYLEPTPTADCTGVWTSWSIQLASFNTLLAFVIVIVLLNSAAEGWSIPRCSRPIYPLLSLLAVSATVARPATKYTEAIKLSQKVSHLGLPLRTFAGHAASDFGNRRALRRELATHLNRVDAAFIKAADQLAGDRTLAARRLAELAAGAANSIAAGRFTAVLPAEALPEEISLEPDRLDGRRLAKACLWSAGTVILVCVALSPLGTPVELLVPLAVVAFPILVYTLLASRFGLSEATRLTRSIGGFFSTSPPL
ncbi:hypothetical protein [Streptomyces ortus]|uniref:Uncharacterized protein n=1 Tax=Streptomyces ortus TaxID=2867268 RepID=A0ABT3V187_9ACTN|nr:hypothetical protein [Streptomyces ortus]MCX4233515.1 hypothetical protein [Streptomyces ortus]